MDRRNFVSAAFIGLAGLLWPCGKAESNTKSSRLFGATIPLQIDEIKLPYTDFLYIYHNYTDNNQYKISYDEKSKIYSYCYKASRADGVWYNRIFKWSYHPRYYVDPRIFTDMNIRVAIYSLIVFFNDKPLCECVEANWIEQYVICRPLDENGKYIPGSKEQIKLYGKVQILINKPEYEPLMLKEMEKCGLYVPSNTSIGN